jgi:hypothetical protein
MAVRIALLSPNEELAAGFQHRAKDDKRIQVSHFPSLAELDQELALPLHEYNFVVVDEDLLQKSSDLKYSIPPLFDTQNIAVITSDPSNWTVAQTIDRDLSPDDIFDQLLGITGRATLARAKDSTKDLAPDL